DYLVTSLIDASEPSKERRTFDVVQPYSEAPPSPSRTGRTRLSSLPRSRCDGEVAASARVHRKGTRNGRSCWRRLPHVLYQLQHGQEPLVWRHLCGAHATRANSVHGPLR